VGFTDAQGSGAADVVVTRAALEFEDAEGSAARKALMALFVSMTRSGVYK
jgi:hypothetical protein